MPHQPDWDFYTIETEDKPVSVMLDLALGKLAPVAEKSLLLWVRITLLHPNADGLVQKDELDRLMELEQELTAAINEKLDGLLAGKTTTAGTRELYFYSNSNSGFDSILFEIKNQYPEYTISGEARPDPEWKVFWQVLYPGLDDMHIIQNRRILRKLKEYGDKHTKPRQVDHLLYFQNDMDMQKFIAEIEKRGFTVVGSETLENNTDFPVQLNISRVDNVNEDYINQVTLTLLRLAGECNGYYDGWGTVVV